MNANSQLTNIPDRHGVNAYTEDTHFEHLLRVYLRPEVLEAVSPHLIKLGALVGAEIDDLAHTADKNPPSLSHRTRQGLDTQRIVKHPSYVAMERLAFGDFALAAISHRSDVLGFAGPLPATVKYALTYLFVQSEFGLCCPVSMTDSLTRTLKKFGSSELVQRFLPALTSVILDELLQGAMFMTEQGAGSDVAATATFARAANDGSGQWLLSGDKWFCSNPDADLAMVLARVDDGSSGRDIKKVSLFLLPRTLDDGTQNHYRIVRLKDKLGSRSMASGEIRLEGARAWLVGERGRGFVQMADMVNNSRLSNGVRAAGMMRRAYAEAHFVATHREAFGTPLIDKPLMRRQLAKLLLPTEQARTMMLQTARALEMSDAGDKAAYSLVRILTPLIKFRACRDARKVTGDAMEVRGGCGYIEEWSDARLLRDAHLGSIWEGTSNIVALDVLRAMQRDDSFTALSKHWEAMLGESGALQSQQADLLKASRDMALKAQALASQVLSALQAGDFDAQQYARQLASALYHTTTLVAFIWEAAQLTQPATREQRLSLARGVMTHKLQGKSAFGFV